MRRGVGFAVGFKNLMYSGGFDDFSTARCRLEDGTVTITSAAVEVGQGLVTLIGQIAREVLGVEDVVIAEAATAGIGSAGSTSASRQTWMTGGAVEAVVPGGPAPGCWRQWPSASALDVGGARRSRAGGWSRPRPEWTSTSPRRPPARSSRRP